MSLFKAQPKKEGRTSKAYKYQPPLGRYMCSKCIGAMGFKRPQNEMVKFTFASAKALKAHQARAHGKES